jgi:hypothetical protein
LPGFFVSRSPYFFDGLPPTTTGHPNAGLAEIELHSRETALLVEAYHRIADATQRRAVFHLIRTFDPSNNRAH